MAHEITANDKLVLHREAAWHGLGLVVDDALTPTQASKLVFPYTVIQKPLFYRGITGNQVIAEGLKVNLRSDTGEEMGRVSDNYQVVQPLELAQFCEALADQGVVKVETAGSIRNGRKMWFLLKGDAFEIANGDSIMPYALVSNGFDGETMFRFTPTTVRVVCSNTWHAVLPRHDTGELVEKSIVIRHTQNIMARIDEIKKSIKAYGTAIDGTKKVMETLAKKEINSDELKQFFADCYQEQFGAIPANPKDAHEERRRTKAMSAYASFSKRFDDEAGIAGTTIWCAANAWSGLVQHDRKGKGIDDADRVEKRVSDNLFGLNQERTQSAFNRAYRLALSQ